MNTRDSVRDYFDRVADHFAANYRKEDAFEERRRIWHCMIEENLSRLKDGGLCFDMGCGDGSLSRPVVALGYQTIGIDQSENMLALARRQCEGNGPVPSYIQASLPLPQDLLEKYRDTAGLILCSSLLEYLDDYERALMQFHGILRKGGRLILSVPNKDALYRMGERVLRFVLTSRNSYLKYQRHQFRPASLRSTMGRLGYTLVHEQYFALPIQRYSSKLFGNFRGRRLATLYLLVVEK
ncbi:MAG TPA: methyltransferase domain-containing protein [Nitrospiria bacterium]|jgi:2-polyprenyl-6-hydroxyphenyl methylase/3-demethylubiquinone-9 3-methyltransferase|nr:methyltransferase domain-containing protein [Nitrospiria bacterium]